MSIINELYMAKFICTLKGDDGGLKKGTTISLESPSSCCNMNNISDALEKKYGKKAKEAAFADWWDIKKV